MFTQNELDAIANLITFHDDSAQAEPLGVDLEKLYDKIVDLLSHYPESND
jgi:hypothetical protein